MSIPKLLKDPLLHFLLIGAALFVFSAWRGESIETGRERITVTAEQVAQVRDAAALVQGRPPTRQELEALIEPTIRDEVLYRESLALGLDVNDDEVRRRLIEKMQYLTQDLADPEPPSEDAVRALYDGSPERFRVPALVTFEQVFLSPSARGDALAADADAALASLRGGAAATSVGDRTPLRERYDDAPREQVDVLFGEALATALFTMSPGEWQGPFESDFGLHLVRLLNRTDSRLPPYEEIRDQVRTAFAEERRAEANAAKYREMRERYDIVIDWPEAATQ
jgi:peptidyl-prolyl cis-trans isomerase C